MYVLYLYVAGFGKLLGKVIIDFFRYLCGTIWDKVEVVAVRSWSRLVVLRRNVWLDTYFSPLFVRNQIGQCFFTNCCYAESFHMKKTLYRS